ncbi:MAG: methyltransferase family protein [Pyrinomonadaceae bacterium]
MNLFDYFQIAIIAIVLIFIIAKIAYLKFVRKINPIAVARTGTAMSRVIEALAFFGLIVWWIEVLSLALHARRALLPEFTHFQLCDAPAARIAGVVLVSVGLIIFALAFFNFGDSWRMGIDRKGAGRLVTKGIFTITRNPIYVFFGLWFIGTFLINGTMIFLVFAVLAIAVLHWQILREEEFLKKRYGEAYETYRKTTPRYLIW